MYACIGSYHPKIVYSSNLTNQTSTILQKFLEDLMAKLGKIRGLAKDLAKNYDGDDSKKLHI